MEYIKFNEVANIYRAKAGEKNFSLPNSIFGIRRIIKDSQNITIRHYGLIPEDVWGVVIHQDKLFLDDYIKFLFDSGVFYAEISQKKGKRHRILVSGLDLVSYDIPIVGLNIQKALGKLEINWEWSARRLNSDFRYASLRNAMFDEIRHLIAMELYYPERMHGFNIYAIDAFMELADLLTFPDKLFFKLTLEHTSIMDQIKKFRSVVF